PADAGGVVARGTTRSPRSSLEGSLGGYPGCRYPASEGEPRWAGLPRRHIRGSRRRAHPRRAEAMKDEPQIAALREEIRQARPVSAATSSGEPQASDADAGEAAMRDAEEPDR